MGLKYFSVKNFPRYQHYKDRNPAWVKLYREILTSESWVLGTDLSRVVQVASMLLAPRYDNKIPHCFHLLKKVMHLECKEAQFAQAIKHLAQTDFLEIQGLEEPCYQDASMLLADCKQDASLDKIREEERREEKNKNCANSESLRKCGSNPRALGTNPRAMTGETATALERFDRFWAAYPKRRSKQYACNVFLKLNPDEQLMACILAAIEQAKTSEQWQKERGKYVPHPASWLNAKGWKDEHEVAVVSNEVNPWEL